MFAALLTTSISIAAAVLDEMLQADSAFLHEKLNVLFSRSQNAESLRRCRFRRNVLSRLILSLADQQLVTGFALMLTGWVVYYDRLDGAHFSLTIYLSCLSSSSHLAALITLRSYFSENPTLALFRICIISIFAILLAVSIALAENSFGPFYFVLWTIAERFGMIWAPPGLIETVTIWPILWAFWTGVWQILPKTRKQVQAWLKRNIWPWCLRAGVRQCSNLMNRHLPQKIDARLRKLFWAALEYLFFLGPCTVFLLQILFALISIAMALAQKFSPGVDISCSLNSKDENEMGYGQILAVLMLALPVISTIEAYKGR